VGAVNQPASDRTTLARALALIGRHGYATAGAVDAAGGAGGNIHRTRAALDRLVDEGALVAVRGRAGVAQVTRYEAPPALTGAEAALLRAAQEPRTARELAAVTGYSYHTARRVARDMVLRGLLRETEADVRCAPTYYHARPLTAAQEDAVRALQRLSVEVQAAASACRSIPRGIETLERRLAASRRALEAAQARLDELTGMAP
jgi:hypothetical protein